MFHEGQQLGEYTLIEKLGRGGFGEVWLVETDEDWFAVKLPHKDQVDWKAITQEIGLWTLCGKHPNVMPLVGARNFNGQIAIISEYAPDGSLEDLLREKGKLSVGEVVEMTIGILEGLQHLHESGIIHRDLKPANILLDGITPRLTDFGISRIISAESLSETVSGTWAYMAPECFDGKRNVQTDIWSFGVIFYRILTGHLPFPQKEQTALVGAIIMQEPKLLDSEFLQKFISKCLAKNSNERYKSVPEIIKDLVKMLMLPCGGKGASTKCFLEIWKNYLTEAELESINSEKERRAKLRIERRAKLLIEKAKQNKEDSSTKKLLLADDSTTIQKVVRIVFEDEGMEVISVGDGNSALEKLLEFKPDVIMADVDMPGLNGYQVCEKIKQNQETKHIPVILLVGGFDNLDEEEAKRVGADDYLTKPFQSIRQLTNKVLLLINKT